MGVLFVFWGQNRPPLLLREEPPLLRPPPRNLPPQARAGLQVKGKPQVMNPSRACM